MSSFDLDPAHGPHAASGLSNEQLEYLHRIVSLEMAVRMRKEDFIAHFEGLVNTRVDQDDMVDALRHDRDRMHFIASVQSDLENLPTTSDEEGSSDQAYGMYL